MYDLMYYGGLILSIAMGVVCVVLFFKLNMMEVIDYYFQTNGKYEFNFSEHWSIPCNHPLVGDYTARGKEISFA